MVQASYKFICLIPQNILHYQNYSILDKINQNLMYASWEPTKWHNYLELSKYLSKNFDFSSYRGRFCGGKGNENRQKSLAIACQSDKFDWRQYRQYCAAINVLPRSGKNAKSVDCQQTQEYTSLPLTPLPHIYVVEYGRKSNQDRRSVRCEIRWTLLNN